jgi:ferredoxin
VLPDLVTLDEWGYPLVHGPVTEELLADAQEAVRLCPRAALRLLDH